MNTDMKLIDKDAVVAEINKRIMDAPIDCYGHQRVWAYNDVKDILDTFEVKEGDLEVEVDRWYNNEAPKEFEDVLYADIEKCAKHFADWQKQQDQSTIELAEDHAMLAGMEKMKEQMMAKAVETTFDVSLPSGLYHKLWIKGCKECDKLLVIKKDEL